MFDEQHKAHQAERAQAQKDRIAQLVKGGKISQEQADKINAKLEEMRSNMESMKDKTPTERKAAMDTKRDELKKWATDNGINEDYLRPAGGPMGHRGHGPNMDQN